MRVILNIFMSDHDTGILPLQMHANRKEKKRKEKKRKEKKRKEKKRKEKKRKEKKRIRLSSSI